MILFHYTTFTGPQLAIFVNDIKSATEVLIKKGADFASRPRAPSSKKQRY